MGSRSRCGFNHGHYRTGYPKCETYIAIEQAKQLKSLWYGGGWLKYKWGGLADQLYHTPTNLPRRVPYAYNGRSKHQMAANISHTPCHCLEYNPGLCKGALMETWVIQQDSFLKQPHRHLGQRAWHWVGISQSLSCTSLWEWQVLQWSVKDCTDSSVCLCWDVQTLGYIYSKSCLVSGPIQLELSSLNNN